MKFDFQEMRLGGTSSGLSAIDWAREDRSRAFLEKLGVTLPTAAAAELKGWQWAADTEVVARCVGNTRTGEIMFLGVVAEYQDLGIGKKLLSLTAASLRRAGAGRIWLAATSDPTARAYGFYRALGCRSTGERTETGEEILEVSTNDRPQS